MSTKRFPLVGGRAMQVTRLDRCGRFLFGNASVVVSEGFVSVAVTANYEDGEEISVTNANGRKCVSRAAEPELTNLSLDVTFCEVDPDIYTAVTGFPKIIDPLSGDVIGFRVNRGVRPNDVAWGLEVWASATGSIGCEPGEEEPFGYLLWPFLSGARVGDYTIENGAVTFVASSAVTKDGSQWGAGIFDRVLGMDGEPDLLPEPVDVLDHQWVLRTLVPPPEPTDGLIPLDDPDDPAATTATAGAPGTFNGVRPEDFADIDTGGVTASPTSAWTSGQHVILGDGSKAHWNGSTDGWVAGAKA